MTVFRSFDEMPPEIRRLMEEHFKAKADLPVTQVPPDNIAKGRGGKPRPRKIDVLIDILKQEGIFDGDVD